MRIDFKKIAILLLSCVILSCTMPLTVHAVPIPLPDRSFKNDFYAIRDTERFQLAKLLNLFGVNLDYSEIDKIDLDMLYDAMDTYYDGLSSAVPLFTVYKLYNKINDTLWFGTSTFFDVFRGWVQSYFGDNVGDTGVIGHKNELRVFPANVPLDFSGYSITNNIRTDFDLKFCYKDTDFIVFTVDTDQNYLPYPFNQELPNKKWVVYVAPANVSYTTTLTSESKLRSSMVSNLVTDPAANTQYVFNLQPYTYTLNNSWKYIYKFGWLYANQTFYFNHYDFPIYKAPSGMTEQQFLDKYYSGQIDTVTGVVYDTPTISDLPDPDNDLDFYNKYFDSFDDEAFYNLTSSITYNYISNVPDSIQYVYNYTTNNDYNFNISLPNISDLVDFNFDLGSATSDYVDSEHGLFTNANTKISEFESTMPDLQLIPGLLSGISFCSTFITDFFYASGGSTGGYGIIFGLSVTFLLLSLIIGVSSFIGKGGK